MGDARGGRSAGGGRNAVRDDLYSEKAGNCGTVGGFTIDIKCVCRVEGIFRRWMQEGFLVVPRGDREITLVHLGRSLARG